MVCSRDLFMISWSTVYASTDKVGAVGCGQVILIRSEHLVVSTTISGYVVSGMASDRTHLGFQETGTVGYVASNGTTDHSCVDVSSPT